MEHVDKNEMVVKRVETKTQMFDQTKIDENI